MGMRRTEIGGDDRSFGRVGELFITGLKSETLQTDGVEVINLVGRIRSFPQWEGSGSSLR